MVTWTAEKDQQLLKGVFQFCDIKMSGPLVEYLAGIIGEGCTPKAVTHRLTNIKNTSKPVRDQNGTPTKAAPSSAKSTPAKTPATGRGRGRGKKVDDEGDAEAGVEQDMSTPTKAKKRSRPFKADIEAAKKKVKTGEVEEDLF
ncbi:hypothetical protein BU23DRAFT_567460 [Bimuria novae-zelandiae CBS 107.79]|uniref:Uncharacterized protein n=1 Tax=Bimuria novae-zelandiae CBS 107.79 TaxID=1447943 RepID=A0A6A5VMR7_9PLEO|nr:hypothetical protein BU23DRAFT_567460 [Bimuria novae-zelandiae CBS 107.79]